MAYKNFQLDGIGQVTVYKRRNSRNIRLSVSHGGIIKVSLPPWLPYRIGTNYAASKRSWLVAQLAKQPTIQFANGMLVGKTRHLRMVSDDRVRTQTRVTTDEVVVTYSNRLEENSDAVQQAAAKACRRALKDEAEKSIPQKLEDLARQHGLKFKALQIRHLKSRWGSCDQSKRIKISYFIVGLPDELIDYVLLHELAHTRHLNHGADFWHLMTELDPTIKIHRKQLREFSPSNF